MFFKGSPQKRYEIIAETISRSDNVLNISYLCKREFDRKNQSTRHKTPFGISEA